MHRFQTFIFLLVSLRGSYQYNYIPDDTSDLQLQK